MRHECINLLQAHPLFDGPFHPHQPDPILVFEQFTHRSHPSVAQMVDVIHDPLGVSQFHQCFCGEQDILFSKRVDGYRGINSQPKIDF